MSGAAPDARYAIAWSGGKDSMLALDRARRAGLRVDVALTVYDRATGRMQFHGVVQELIGEQVRRLGMEPVLMAAAEDGYEAAFLSGLDALRARDVGGIIFGNIHLGDVRAWYETRTREHRLEHVEPLWQDAPALLLAELLARGHRARVVSVDLQRGREEWLGRELDAAFAAELLDAGGADPLGEYGEYHTFVFAGPLFAAPLEVGAGDRWTVRGHALLDLVEPSSVSGCRRPPPRTRRAP